MTESVLILTIDIFEAENVVPQVGFEPTHPGFMPSALPIELPEHHILCLVEVYNNHTFIIRLCLRVETCTQYPRARDIHT